jgi:hypothetical protein
MGATVLTFFSMFIVLALVIWAAGRFVHKTGISGWTILLWTPPFVVIAYWRIAFAHWPKVDDAGKPDVNAF